MFKINTDQVISWTYRNFKVLLAISLLFVVAALLFITFNMVKKDREKVAKNTLISFQKSLNSLIKKPKTESKAFALPLKEEEKELVLTDQMKTQAQAYKQAIENHRKFKVTVYFAIDLADFYYRYGQKELAEDLLSDFSSPLAKKTLNQLASFQLAAYYMNEKECDRSLAIFEGLISNQSAKAFHLESRLQKGICLEHLNRYKEALAEYKSLSNESPDSYLSRQAKDYEKLLILKQKMEKK